MKDFVLSSRQEFNHEAAVNVFDVTFYGMYEKRQTKSITDATSQSFVKYAAYPIIRIILMNNQVSVLFVR